LAKVALVAKLPTSAGVAKLVDARDLSKLSAPGETRGAELLKFGETGHRQSRAKHPGRTAGVKV
jgi:hypothetical protein